MIEESAYVIATEGELAWVETERKSTCGSCTARKGCGTGVLAKVVGRKLTQVVALNRAGARPGDTVVVGIDESSLVRGSLAVYAMPLLTLFAGALLGEYGFSAWAGEAGSLFGGIAGLLLGFAWLRRFSRRSQADPRYQPVVLRRIGAAGSASPGVLPL